MAGEAMEVSINPRRAPHYTYRVPDNILLSASELSKDYNLYFKATEDFKVVDIELLRFEHALEESLKNAVELMQKAGKSGTSKRTPILVERNQKTGFYHILDGNSTALIGLCAGWETIPVILTHETQPGST